MQPNSVFVGNIPYDATEEKLKDIFSAVGPVLSFRIVFDRETGKPKGYGFCQYKDQETANSAIRNLNGYDLGGRKLRVDCATNGPETGGGGGGVGGGGGNMQMDDQSNRQQQSQQQQQSQPSNQQQPQQQQQTQSAPLTDPMTVINGLISTTPPEQLFEICKQLKTSLIINPNETRQLLVTNPQLAYTILQILATINAVDAQTAINTMHTALIPPNPLQQMLPLIAPLGPATMPVAAAPTMLPQHPNPMPVVNTMTMPTVQMPTYAYSQNTGPPPMAAPADPRRKQ